MFKTAPFAAALFGLAVAATPALAAEKTEVRVAFNDLDLTTSEGQHALGQRLNSAARSACGYYGSDPRALAASAKARACYKQARGKARQAMAIAVDGAADTRLGG
jgi:UrcA family protein